MSNKFLSMANSISSIVYPVERYRSHLAFSISILHFAFYDSLINVLCFAKHILDFKLIHDVWLSKHLNSLFSYVSYSNLQILHYNLDSENSFNIFDPSSDVKGLCHGALSVCLLNSMTIILHYIFP